MAVRGCPLCGYQIHYHGEPEGTTPVEHVFCNLSDWHDLETENLTADYLELEHEEKFFYAWRCPRCGTFTGFAGYVGFSGAYAPKEEFSSELMQEPFEFGLFWNDFQWFEITESDDNHASEVLTKFPVNRWYMKNDDELRFYSDEARTNCVGQFRRLEVVSPITVATMSLVAFKKMLESYDGEIDFFYRDRRGYEIIKEHLSDGRLRVIVNHGFGNPQPIYSVIVTEGENFADDLVNAKILLDGKSIAEAQGEIEL